MRQFIVLILLLLWLSACNNSSSNAIPANAKAMEGGSAGAGEMLFTQNGCMACHAVTSEAPPGIGPSLAGIASRGQETVQKPDYTGTAKTAEGYIWESITDPRVYVAEGYSSMMPVTYQQTLDDQQMADLVAYLLSLN